MLFYSLLVLWFAKDGHHGYRPIQRPWYIGKRHPGFADMLATLRVQSVKEMVLQRAAPHTLLRKPAQILFHTLKLAA